MHAFTRRVLPALALIALFNSQGAQALQPSFPAEGLQEIEELKHFGASVAEMKRFGGLFGGSVSLVTQTPDGPIGCSGTMLTSQIMLTASHCFNKWRPLADDRITVNGMTVEFAPAHINTMVAQGATNLYAEAPGSPYVYGPGTGAEAFGRLTSYVRNSTVFGPDLALAFVEDPWNPAAQVNFQATGARLPRAVENYRGLSTSGGIKIEAWAVGHSYSEAIPQNPLERTRLAGLNPIDLQYERDDRFFLGGAYWRSDFRNVRRTVENLVPGTSQVLTQLSATPVGSDSGGGLFAFQGTGIPSPVLIGVLSHRLPEDLKSPGTDYFWTPVADSLDFITQATAALEEQAYSLPGMSPFRPYFASDSARFDGGRRMSQFDLPDTLGMAWLAVPGAVEHLISVGNNWRMSGLDLGDSVPLGLFIETRRPGDVELTAVQYVNNGDGSLSFAEAVTNLRISGNLPLDTSGSWVFALWFDPPWAGAESMQRLAATSANGFTVTIESITPVPEPGSAALFALGLLVGIGRRARRRHTTTAKDQG